MTSLQWVIVCRRARVDEQRRITLEELVDEVTVGESIRINDLIDGPFTVVTSWSGRPAAGEVLETRVRILCPQGQLVAESAIGVKPTQVTRVNQVFPVIPFRGAGQYQMSVDLGREGEWHCVGGTLLRVLRSESHLHVR